MNSAGPYFSIDDKDLDDATLWALMDSAAASLSKARKPLAIKAANHQTPPSVSHRSPPLLKSNRTPRSIQYSPQSTSKLHRDGEVVHEPWIYNRPQKIARTSSSSEVSETSPIAVVTNSYRTPITSAQFSPETYLSPGIGLSGGNLMKSPEYSVQSDETGIMRHSLSGMFPTVSLFKEYQNAAMAVTTGSINLKWILHFPALWSCNQDYFCVLSCGSFVWFN